MFQRLPYLCGFLLLAVLLPLGCASQSYTDKRDDLVQVPEKYGEYEIEGVQTDAWCSDFGRKGLERAVRTTWSDNLELKAAWARVEQARARVAQARSHLWPSARAEAGVTTSNARDRLPDSLGGDGSGGPVDVTFEASLAASYEIDLWGKYRHRARAARLELRAARAAARSLSMTLTSRVAEAWFDVVAAKRRLELLGRQVDLSREFLNLTEMRFRKGLADELDITQQRQNLEALEGERIDARLRLERSRHRLNVLIGAKPGSDGVPVGEKLPKLPDLPNPGIPAGLLERRPDMRRALLLLRAADQRTAAAVADQLPTLELSAGLFLQAGSLANLLDQLVWSVSAAVGQVLFDGGRLEAAQREAESVAEERLYLYGQTLLEALEDVRNALVGEKRQRERVRSLRDELESARASLEAARSQYREGNLDYLRVLDALQRLQIAQRELLDARRLQFSYRIGLCRAIGGTWATEMQSPLEASTDSDG